MSANFSRADYCVIGVAECFRGDGEIMANPIGTTPAIGGRLAREMFEPDLVMTDGVIEAEFGAHFTECVPDYPRDEAFQREYTAGAKDADAWAGWKAKYLDCGDHAEYRKVVGL